MKFITKRTMQLNIDDTTREFTQEELRGIQARLLKNDLMVGDDKVIVAILSSICLKLNEP